MSGLVCDVPVGALEHVCCVVAQAGDEAEVDMTGAVPRVLDVYVYQDGAHLKRKVGLQLLDILVPAQRHVVNGELQPVCWLLGVVVEEEIDAVLVFPRAEAWGLTCDET